MNKDYIYALTPLLEDALTERDMVLRQTSCTVVKHLALGVVGLSREDALMHLLNFVMPCCLDVSPHLIQACRDALNALRIALGPSLYLNYIYSGLFHPARRFVGKGGGCACVRVSIFCVERV